jgi:hypothetical protein
MLLRVLRTELCVTAQEEEKGSETDLRLLEERDLVDELDVTEHLGPAAVARDLERIEDLFRILFARTLLERFPVLPDRGSARPASDRRHHADHR